MLQASFNSANTYAIVGLCDASLSTDFTATKASFLMLSTANVPVKLSSTMTLSQMYLLVNRAWPAVGKSKNTTMSMLQSSISSSEWSIHYLTFRFKIMQIQRLTLQKINIYAKDLDMIYKELFPFPNL